MPHAIVVTARKPFIYQTRAFEVGDRFECDPVHAAVLRYQGKIALVSDRQPIARPPAVASRARRGRRVLTDREPVLPT